MTDATSKIELRLSKTKTIEKNVREERYPPTSSTEIEVAETE